MLPAVIDHQSAFSPLPQQASLRLLHRDNGGYAPDSGSADYVLVGDVTSAPLRGITLPAGWPGSMRRLQQPMQLRVLHLNDLHGHITRLSPFGARPVASAIAWYVHQIRTGSGPEVPEPLLFSAGDDISGSVFDNLMREEDPDAITHAAYCVYSALRLTAAAVGNHDLDFGSGELARAVRGEANFPVLSANIRSRSLASAVYPAAVFVRRGIRIGVIGLTTPVQHKHVSDDLQVVHPEIALAHLMPVFRPLCDVVIVLSHLGYSAYANPAAVDPVGDVELAEALPPDTIHLIIGGHTHHALNEDGLEAANIVNGVPIVQAGANGRFLGEVTITLEVTPDRQHTDNVPTRLPTVSVTDARLISVADLPTEPTFERDVVQPLLNRVTPSLRRVIGRSENEAGLSSDGLRERYDRGESALANFVTDALYERCHANGVPVDLAMVDASILRSGIPVDAALTVGDWHQVMPFSDIIQLYRLTGRQLLALVVDNALRLGRAGEARTERGFVQFSRHMRYRIELGGSRWDNIVSRVIIRGDALAKRLDHRFVVASHSHFRLAALSWERREWGLVDREPVSTSGWFVQPTELFLRDELLFYIQDRGGIMTTSGAKCDGRVRVLQETPLHEHRSILYQPAIP